MVYKKIYSILWTLKRNINCMWNTINEDNRIGIPAMSGIWEVVKKSEISCVKTQNASMKEW